MRRPEPQYEGEDIRLTSQKELAGWYSYGWAAEVFAVCALGTLLWRIPNSGTANRNNVQARSFR